MKLQALFLAASLSLFSLPVKAVSPTGPPINMPTQNGACPSLELNGTTYTYSRNCRQAGPPGFHARQVCQCVLIN